MAKRNTAQLNVSIPTELVSQLKEAAEQEQRSVSNLVSWLLTLSLQDLKWSTKDE